MSALTSALALWARSAQPFLRRLLGLGPILMAVLWVGPVVAEEESVPTTASTDSLQMPSPTGALLRSAVLPGWGQYYNGRPVKALLFSGAAVGFAAAAVGELSGPANETLQARDDRVARRNTRFLYLIGTTTFAALDAFVDAHLADVEIEPTVDWARKASLLQVRWRLP